MEQSEAKYLTFALEGGHVQYAIAVERVKQITGITNIPVTPKTIKGFINLRGKIIPVIDLRLKFDLGEKPFTDRTYVIVGNIHVEEVKKQIGIAVDEVSEVVNIQEVDVEPLPKDRSTSMLKGTARTKEKEILLMNIDSLLNAEEINLLKQT